MHALMLKVVILCSQAELQQKIESGVFERKASTGLEVECAVTSLFQVFLHMRI